MLNPNITTQNRRPCACRGAGICPDCEGHECAGHCTCNRDGAPEHQEQVTSGYVNPSAARLAAWQEKQEARR